MAEKKEPSRRNNSEKQSPSRRNDVIRCENCGEDYSVTYKRCPFCDERPGRGISGRRVAGGGGGGSVHPVQLVGLVVSLVLIIAALFIVFKYVGPLLFGNKPSGGQSSVSTSQSSDLSTPIDSSSSSETDPNSSSSIGDISQPEPPAVTINSISLSKVDITLQPDELCQITATVSPAGSGAVVVWTSSNPDVLSVDQNGNVRNVNSGSSLVKATVTATCGDKSAECTVYCRPGSTGAGTSTGSGTGTSNGTVAANTPGTIVNAENGLNIRSGPGSSYEVLASAANGATVIILEDSGDGWYKIDYGNGKTGYVSSDYVSVSG